MKYQSKVFSDVKIQGKNCNSISGNYYTHFWKMKKKKRKKETMTNHQLSLTTILKSLPHRNLHTDPQRSKARPTRPALIPLFLSTRNTNVLGLSLIAIVGGRLITSEDSPLVCRWNDGNKEVGVWKRGWKSREWGWSGGVERCTRRGRND